MPNFLTSRVKFMCWFSQMIVDAQDKDKLGMDLRDIIVCVAEKLKELVMIEYAQRPR